MSLAEAEGGHVPMRVVSDGQLDLPGHCAGCGSISGPMVKVTRTEHGTVYLCTTNCVAASVRLWGGATDAEIADLRGRLRAAEQQAAAFAAEQGAYDANDLRAWLVVKGWSA